MKLTINKATNGQFFVNLIAKNGRVLMTSETYKAKAKAVRLADKLATEFVSAEIFVTHDLTKPAKAKK